MFASDAKQPVDLKSFAKEHLLLLAHAVAQMILARPTLSTAASRLGQIGTAYACTLEGQSRQVAFRFLLRLGFDVAELRRT